MIDFRVISSNSHFCIIFANGNDAYYEEPLVKYNNITDYLYYSLTKSGYKNILEFRNDRFNFVKAVTDETLLTKTTGLFKKTSECNNTEVLQNCIRCKNDTAVIMPADKFNAFYDVNCSDNSNNNCLFIIIMEAKVELSAPYFLDYNSPLCTVFNLSRNSFIRNGTRVDLFSCLKDIGRQSVQFLNIPDEEEILALVKEIAIRFYSNSISVMAYTDKIAAFFNCFYNSSALRLEFPATWTYERPDSIRQDIELQMTENFNLPQQIVDWIQGKFNNITDTLILKQYLKSSFPFDYLSCPLSMTGSVCFSYMAQWDNIKSDILKSDILSHDPITTKRRIQNIDKAFDVIASLNIDQYDKSIVDFDVVYTYLMNFNQPGQPDEYKYKTFLFILETYLNSALMTDENEKNIRNTYVNQIAFKMMRLKGDDSTDCIIKESIRLIIESINNKSILNESGRHQLDIMLGEAY